MYESNGLHCSFIFFFLFLLIDKVVLDFRTIFLMIPPFRPFSFSFKHPYLVCWIRGAINVNFIFSEVKIKTVLSTYMYMVFIRTNIIEDGSIQSCLVRYKSTKHLNYIGLCVIWSNSCPQF